MGQSSSGLRIRGRRRKLIITGPRMSRTREAAAVYGNDVGDLVISGKLPVVSRIFVLDAQIRGSSSGLWTGTPTDSGTLVRPETFDAIRPEMFAEAETADLRCGVQDNIWQQKSVFVMPPELIAAILPRVNRADVVVVYLNPPEPVRVGRMVSDGWADNQITEAVENDNTRFARFHDYDVMVTDPEADIRYILDNVIPVGDVKEEPGGVWRTASTKEKGED